MLDTGNQRWRARRHSYRPPDEPIRASLYDVAEIPDDSTARAFVEAHHYSRSYPAARLRYGLYCGGELVGVSILSHPCNDRALSNVFPGDPLSCLELGRFVLLDEVPGNGETWMLGRVFELLRRRGFRGVLSFSDPVPRTDAFGRLVFPGHIGTIYQAHNAQFLGRGEARTLKVLSDGTVLSDRTLQKIRAGERGRRYGIAQLVGYGAEPPVPGEDVAAWLARWVPLLTRPLRHPGNLRYAWPLRRGVTIAMSRQPYPKLAAGLVA